MAVLVGRRAGLSTSPVGDIVILLAADHAGTHRGWSDRRWFGSVGSDGLSVFLHRVLHGLLSVGDRFTKTCGDRFMLTVAVSTSLPDAWTSNFATSNN